MKINEETKSIAVSRITVLWALSETALGGFLHALHIPLTGIIVGGAAIIFITLIAQFSDKKNSILKATLIVLIVKGIVSPHTPPAAYFAVFLQGFLGQIIFQNRKYFTFKVVLLSVTTLVYFSIQKLVIYTIVFGNTFWDSINVYTNYILTQFFTIQDSSNYINYSIIIASAYVFIHLLAGLFIGILAGKIPQWLHNSLSNDLTLQQVVSNELIVEQNSQAGDRKWVAKKQKNKIVILIILMSLIVTSYFTPDLGSNQAMDIILMLLRALIITFIWYAFISPLLLKYVKKYFNKYQNVYAEEVEEIIKSIPHFKSLTLKSWSLHSHNKGFKKYKLFLFTTFATLLFTNIDYK